jgi:cold shock CspA family protein
MGAETLTRGTVSAWFPEQGWGVLASPEVKGTVFAPFSMIRDQTGYRELREGQQVAFSWARGGQDGCDHRAIDVYSSGEPTPTQSTENPAGGAYSSELTVDFGDGPERIS